LSAGHGAGDKTKGTRDGSGAQTSRCPCGRVECRHGRMVVWSAARR
jgi:hypothetical protein